MLSGWAQYPIFQLSVFRDFGREPMAMIKSPLQNLPTLHFRDLGPGHRTQTAPGQIPAEAGRH